MSKLNFEKLEGLLYKKEILCEMCFNGFEERNLLIPVTFFSKWDQYNELYRDIRQKERNVSLVARFVLHILDINSLNFDQLTHGAFSAHYVPFNLIPFEKYAFDVFVFFGLLICPKMGKE